MLFTSRTLLLLLITAPLLALGTWFPIMQWIALAYALLILAMAFFDWRMAGEIKQFELHREHDNKLSLGAENLVRISLRNRSWREVSFTVRDEAPEQFKIETRTMEGHVQPHETWASEYHVRPLRRGDYQFGDLSLRWLGPLGLVIRQARVDAKEPVKVYPNLLDVRRYDLLLRRNRLQEMGLRTTRQFGEGTEFERLREYLPDDEYRRINWKATARRHFPVTTEYQTERSQQVIAVLDVGRMMQSPVADIAKLDYVVNAVLLLTYVATGKGDRVGMMSFADDVMHYLGPRQGRGQFYRMLELLYAVEPQPVEPNYRKALAYLAIKQRRRALVVVFTDLTGGASLNSLVAQMAILARSSLPLVVTISDPDIVNVSHMKPADSLGVYQRAAASQLLDERRVVLDSLRQRGVSTLDVPANQLSMSVVNRYLELKGRMQL